MRTSYLGLLTAAFTTAAFAAPQTTSDPLLPSASPAPAHALVSPGVEMPPLVHSLPTTKTDPLAPFDPSAPVAGEAAAQPLAGSVAPAANQVDAQPMRGQGAMSMPGGPAGGPMMAPRGPLGPHAGATPAATPIGIINRIEPPSGKGVTAPAPMPTAMPEMDGPQRKDETTVDYLWRKSDVAFHLGDYERAISLHKSIAFLDPKDPENYGVGAWLIWSVGRGDEAIAFMNQGLQAAPDSWEMWNEAGEQNDLQKHIGEAAKDYAKAITLIPKTEDSQMLRRRYAHAAEKSGDINSAIETWKGLVESFPKEAVNRNNLARVEKLQPTA